MCNQCLLAYYLWCNQMTWVYPAILKCLWMLVFGVHLYIYVSVNKFCIFCINRNVWLMTFQIRLVWNNPRSAKARAFELYRCCTCCGQVSCYILWFLFIDVLLFSCMYMHIFIYLLFFKLLISYIYICIKTIIYNYICYPYIYIFIS